MKKLIRCFLSLFRPIIILLLRIFFDKKFLSGKYFDKGFTGIRWALKAAFQRNILRLAPPMPFPVGLTCTVISPEKIFFHPDDLNNFQSPGTYYQNFKGNIILGRGSYIAPNVGLITANHDLTNLEEHTEGRDIIIGEGCWIGMNSVILPGVTLGKGTIVAAGAVVTKSYLGGSVILAGVPAVPIKTVSM